MNTVQAMMSEFHFQQPLWFAALIPLALLLIGLNRITHQDHTWRKIIDPKLLPLLLTGRDSGTRSVVLGGLTLIWLLGVLALADPVWTKIPKPVFQTNAARVIVLDLSRSMLTDDLKPSRLARARFKIEDILRRQESQGEEGQTGLVVFAGDAFTAAPLTRDNQTIRSLLKVLNPEIMPVQGSRADLGLDKAREILEQAGIQSGEVLLITDAAADDLTREAAQRLARAGHRVSVLGVGTPAGGLIPHVRDRNGQPVVAKLQTDQLSTVAKIGGGAYHTITSDSRDLESVLRSPAGEALDAGDTVNNSDDNEALSQEDWQSTGPYLVLLLLPLAALAFRRGWLMSIALLPLAGSLMLTPTTAEAEGLGQYWDNLWLRQEQQADRSLRNQQFDRASQLAKDPLRHGSAEYKRGNYTQALKDFSAAEGADASYNRGNTLAQLKRFEEAIKSYDEALKLNPDLADAKTNKQRIEEWLKKQQQQAQDQSAQQSDEKQSEEQQQSGQSQQQSDKEQSSQDQNSEDQESSQSEDNSEGQESPQNSQSNKDAGKPDEANQDSSSSDKQSADQQQAAPDSAENGETKQQDTAEKKEKGDGDNNEDKASDEKKADDKGGEENDQNQFSKAASELEKQAQQQDSAGEDKPSSSADQPAANERNNEKVSDEKTGQSDAATQHSESEPQAPPTEQAARVAADALSDEEKMAAEQWLRRIPDDPGGLLRRKFLMQYQQRVQPIRNRGNPSASSANPDQTEFNPW